MMFLAISAKATEKEADNMTHVTDPMKWWKKCISHEESENLCCSSTDLVCYR